MRNETLSPDHIHTMVSPVYVPFVIRRKKMLNMYSGVDSEVIQLCNEQLVLLDKP
jgi:hypothetical protein